MTEHGLASEKPVVAIGVSADGVGAIRAILGALPAGLDAPIVIVMHRGPQQVSRLAQVIAKHSALPVKEAASTDVLTPGHVYLAPPGTHLIVADGQLNFDPSAKVSFARPSIDVLFESVAKVYGARAVGVILSGAGRDGVRGLQAIRTAGGVTIVQDPVEARFSRLPEAAIAANGIDFTVPLAEIAPTILAVVSRRQEAQTSEDTCTPAGTRERPARALDRGAVDG
jgi:two-component system chemotaxis response regulator CheB